MDAYLETSRLLVRRFDPGDVDRLVELSSDVEVMRYLTGGVAVSRHEIEHDRLPGYVSVSNEPHGFGTYAVQDRTGGEFLGWVALGQAWDGSMPIEVEVGWRFRRSAWGHGYASEAAVSLLHKGFVELGVELAWAETMAVNQRSRRVMERLGMRHVRTEHRHFDDPIPGTEHGEVVYAITRVEWCARTRGG